MIVLGVDPGTRVTGWGVIDIRPGAAARHIAHGQIRTDAKAPLWVRLVQIHRDLDEVAATYSPAAFAIERAFVSKNAQTALKLGHARGVSMLAAVNRGAQVFEYAPSQIKSAVTGSGRADKHQVAEMVRVILGLTKAAPADASDALAAAICHGHGAHGAHGASPLRVAR